MVPIRRLPLGPLIFVVSAAIVIHHRHASHLSNMSRTSRDAAGMHQ